MSVSKADLGLVIGLLGLLAAFGLGPVLLLVALASYLVGRATR
jgi:hypothetical protein